MGQSPGRLKSYHYIVTIEARSAEEANQAVMNMMDHDEHGADWEPVTLDSKGWHSIEA